MNGTSKALAFAGTSKFFGLAGISKAFGLAGISTALGLAGTSAAVGLRGIDAVLVADNGLGGGGGTLDLLDVTESDLETTLAGASTLLGGGGPNLETSMSTYLTEARAGWVSEPDRAEPVVEGVATLSLGDSVYEGGGELKSGWPRARFVAGSPWAVPELDPVLDGKDGAGAPAETGRGGAPALDPRECFCESKLPRFLWTGGGVNMDASGAGLGTLGAG